MCAEQAGGAHGTCPAQYEVVQEEVQPVLNTKESSFPGGPGSWEGLSSLRGGQLGAVFVGCLPEGVANRGQVS